ncbi:auxin-responsive protein SAUR71-like [Triticum dicoccoides]|uniref:auxin-responsive protein SAUR71-like n=1 Tax=Triticum dicoccoides TaxID=85692 RepID=UPI00188E6390|nr:auxin-responsive protein SAUR71-like [Triticum dicoccoides]
MDARYVPPLAYTTSSVAGGAVDSSSAAAAMAYRQLRAPKQASTTGGAKVPQGHVPVCVGEEGGPVERFAVRADLLGRPAFAALLLCAAHEYGYGHPGALRIPCPVADFRGLLVRLSDFPYADEC